MLTAERDGAAVLASNGKIYVLRLDGRSNVRALTPAPLPLILKIPLHLSTNQRGNEKYTVVLRVRICAEGGQQ